MQVDGLQQSFALPPQQSNIALPSGVSGSGRSKLNRIGIIAPTLAAGGETQVRNEVFRASAEAAMRVLEELIRIKSNSSGQGAGSKSRQELQFLYSRFKATQTDVRDQLNQIGQRILDSDLDPEIEQRHLAAMEKFDQGSAALDAAFYEISKGKSGAIDSAFKLMQRLKFREEAPLLNATSPPRSPVLEAPRMTPQDADAELAKAGISSQPSSNFAVSGTGTAAQSNYLGQTVEIQITQEIIDRAAALGHSPQAIYEFVRNEVAFQPYLGSRKGSVETLAQQRGNDTDQASLLLALLRAAGIPSRYVRGTVEMPPSVVMEWLGVDDPGIAASILTTAGLDGVAIMNGTVIEAIRCTRVWVEAFVPYTNYRGNQNDSIGPIWIPLDPSLTGSKIFPGQDVLSSMGFDVDNFIADYISTFTPESPLEQIDLDIQAFLNANNPGTTVADIERKQEIDPQLLGLLPATLPYQVLAVTDRLDTLEDSKRYKVRFHLYDGATTLIDHTMNLSEIAGRRVTIEYQGATPADQATIDSFGGIYDTPPNLVNVIPLLKFDGGAIATATNSVGMGFSHGFDMQFIQPPGASNVQPLIQNQIIAGNGQAIAFDTFLDLRNTFFDSASFSPGDFLESILHSTANEYLSRVDRAIEKLGRLMGVVTTQDVSEAIVENAISVSFSFGIPVSFEWTGLVVDADRRIIGPFAVNGNQSLQVPYMKVQGLEGSIQENRVFEDVFGQDAVSTVKILELSSDQGIPLCTITSNIFSECPGISQSASVINAINAALAQGHVITIPESPITVSLWSGTGYIDLDPTTGAGGYIISGGISGAVQSPSGGATVDSWPVSLPCTVTAVTANVLVPPADRPDPSAVFCTDANPLVFKVDFTSTCDDGSTKNHQETFTTSKTTKQIGGGHYDLKLQAFGTTTIRKITIVELDKLEASEGDEWDDMDNSDDTKTVVTKKDMSGDVTVTATPKPNLTEAELPACWDLTGGTAITGGKLQRKVTKTAAAKTTFKAKSGTEEKTMDVVVAKAKFEQAPTEGPTGNKYGYDTISNAEDDDHVSVKKSDSTMVNVLMEGGVDRKYLKFVSDDETIAKVTDPGSGTDASFLLEIKGQNKDKAETLIKIRAAKDTGQEITKIAANVYKSQDITKWTVYRITDSTSAQTSPLSALTSAGLKTFANNIVKYAVIDFLDVDVIDKNISYDKNKNGALDWYYDGGTQTEFSEIQAANLTGDPKIAIVKTVNFAYRLSNAAARGQKKVKLNGSDYISGWVGRTFKLGTGANQENVVVSSVSGTEVTTQANLTKNHTAGEELIAEFGAGVSADPQIVEDGGVVSTTALHETLHRSNVANLSDVTSSVNIMYFAAAGSATAKELRYKPQAKKYVAGNENQWNTVPR